MASLNTASHSISWQKFQDKSAFRAFYQNSPHIGEKNAPIVKKLLISDGYLLTKLDHRRKIEKEISIFSLSEISVYLS